MKKKALQIISRKTMNNLQELIENHPRIILSPDLNKTIHVK